MESIQGKVAFVTGAAGGMGLGIAQSLLSSGAQVVLADLDAPELQRQVAELGESAAAFAFDVADESRWPEARRFVEGQFGPVDILVNNAGVGPDLRPLADMTYASFHRLITIKLEGCFLGVNTFAPGMRERRQGHIVQTASMAGLMANPKLGAYTTANFGVVGLSEVLRKEMEPHDVGVSVLCPGTVATRLRQTTRAITGSDELAAGGDKFVSPSNTTLSPAAVGQMVVRAILEDELYILTHGEYREPVGQRCALLMEAFAQAPDS